MMAVRYLIDFDAPDDEAYCPACGDKKPLDDFGPDARKANGRQSLCRECDAARKRRIRMITALRVTFDRRW
jgi:NMD protein affecting ribosome stability and mRNA decay